MPQLTNSAVSATTSSYTSQCVHDFVPPDADLVVVEFSVNDWEVADAAAAWMNNSQRCALVYPKPLGSLQCQTHMPCACLTLTCLLMNAEGVRVNLP